MNTNRLVRFLILFFWVVVLILLLQKNSEKTPVNHVTFPAGEESKETSGEWLGIYLKNEKVGYSKTRTDRAGDLLAIFEETIMVLNTLGINQRIESKLKSVVTTDYSLRSFDFSLKSGSVPFSLHGDIDGNELNLVMVSGEKTTRSTLPAKGIPFLSNTINPYILKQGLIEGKKFCLPFFDPSTLSYRDITIEVLRKEKILFSGSEVEVFKMKESCAGTETLVFITESGDIVKEEAPMGLTLLKESQEKALSGDWLQKAKTDVGVSTAVTVAVPIENPRTTKFLKVRISNVPLNDFDLSEGRQNLQGDCLEIRQEEQRAWETFTLPYPSSDLKVYMEPTPWIQSTDDRIIIQAKKIAGDKRDAEKTARALTEWVFYNVKKEPLVSIPNALDVLEQKVGDCNEHTALFTALSRSLGIPTRVCVGLVYLKEKFYYHAWPEIYLGRWVAVDPTFNQFPADATHIRLVVGDLSEQIKILNVVDKVKLEVMDFS